MEFAIFENIIYWHWIVLGLVLFVLEMLMPGFVLLWFGFGAIVLGGLLFIFPDMMWQWQFFIFSMLSVLSLAGWRYWSRNNPADDPDSGVLNQRGKALIGRETLLIEPIVNGIGRIQVDDTFWRVHGTDPDNGLLVRIIDVEGATLKVEAV